MCRIFYIFLLDNFSFFYLELVITNIMKRTLKVVLCLLISAGFFTGCNSSVTEEDVSEKIPIILDTDANNELDDQHAIAYLLKNQEVFDIVGITVNTTRSGGLIDGHYDEAMRILTLFNEQDNILVKKGADASYGEIKEELGKEEFDGVEAVDFIISEARKYKNKELVLLPIGKLTNIALALKKAPDIIKNVRVVWLGSNYPDPGEYNLDNDTSSLNFVLESNVHFEIVTVSYGRETGTSAIHVSLPEIDSVMPGKGPRIDGEIIGRHGGEFNNFGDYSVNLFHHIDLYGNPPSRSLFDLGAVAIVKNPNWAESRTIPTPYYSEDGWVDPKDEEGKIVLWEYFQRDSIVKDFYSVLD
jgi:purine nucleosidase